MKDLLFDNACEEERVEGRQLRQQQLLRVSPHPSAVPPGETHGRAAAAYVVLFEILVDEN